ncbi:MAG: N-acetylmuramoyl-L-alanine amidase [Anaerolineae bacterium]|nr:N-acetylmuramoyl-L-alanine amidase [Anaerolineae bacterium]
MRLWRCWRYGLLVNELRARPERPVLSSLPTLPDLPTSATTLDPAVLIPAPYLIQRAGWNALPLDHTAENENGFFSEANPEGWRTYTEPLAQVYTTAVIHHTVIYEGDDLLTMQEAQRLHQQDRKWADVGYHYLIGKAGAIYEGRSVTVRGVHTAGYNTGTVGVCLMGNFMVDLPTAPQLQALRLVLGWLAQGLQLTHLASHRQFNPETLCPGDNLQPLSAGIGR